MYSKKHNTYTCEVWSSSTDLKGLKSWLLLLPLSCPSTGLSTKIKRFTLLRSPLGNKTAKDQFERKEYRSYFSFECKEPCTILAFLDVLRYSGGIKSKVVFKTLDT